MANIAQKIYSFCTYGLVGLNFVLTLEFIKSLLLSIGALILLALQIKIHWIKLKKEKGDKNYQFQWAKFLKELIK